MKEGKWLQPRYDSKDIFEKDYPKIDLSGITVKCPGCKELVQLNRRSAMNRAAGWCKKCNRAVSV